MPRFPFIGLSLAAVVALTAVVALSGLQHSAAATRRARRSAPKITAPGSLVLAGDGRAQKGFSDFAGVDLVTQVGDARADGTISWKRVSPRGTVHTTRTFPMAHVTDDGRRLSFETRPVRGVEYRFTGTWINNAPAGSPVLKGKLTKLVNGAAAAAAEVGFVTEEGD